MEVTPLLHGTVNFFGRFGAGFAYIIIARFLHCTVRFVNGSVSFEKGTVRFVNGTVRFLHGTVQLVYRCSCTLQGLYLEQPVMFPLTVFIIAYLDLKAVTSNWNINMRQCLSLSATFENRDILYILREISSTVFSFQFYINVMFVRY